MSPATLRKLEWASDCISAGGDKSWDDWCPACHAMRKKGHTPGCELYAAIREAERRETGERPEIRVGDVVSWESSDVVTRVRDDSSFLTERGVSGSPRDVVHLEREGVSLWRKEAPTP